MATAEKHSQLPDQHSHLARYEGRLHGNLEMQRREREADHYLGTAAVITEMRGVQSATTPLETAVEAYEEILEKANDPTVLVKDALALEALAEAEKLEGIETQDGVLIHRSDRHRIDARSDIHKAWDVIGGTEADHVDVAPILVVEAKILADEGDPDIAQHILNTMGEKVPAVVEKLKKDLEEDGTMPLQDVTKAVLELERRLETTERD